MLRHEVAVLRRQMARPVLLPIDPLAVPHNWPDTGSARPERVLTWSGGPVEKR
jgi:hypothetical protein